jgi:hypothetical protein
MLLTGAPLILSLRLRLRSSVEEQKFPKLYVASSSLAGDSKAIEHDGYATVCKTVLSGPIPLIASIWEVIQVVKEVGCKPTAMC